MSVIASIAVPVNGGRLEFDHSAGAAAPSLLFEPDGGDWYVLHTKSRQEKALAATLVNRGVPHFLPLIKRVRYYGRRRTTVDTPLFAGYVFLRGDLEQAYEADRTRRVASVITVADQAGFDAELHNVYEALVRQAPLELFPYLRKGVRVVVRTGPFQGLRGLIESRTSPDRLILQVNMLGQATSMEIDGALLDPVQ